MIPTAQCHPSKQAMWGAYRADETQILDQLIGIIGDANSLHEKAKIRATDLIDYVHDKARKKGGVDAFLSQYGLTTDEGIVLMCLAEALLRIPDAYTADLFVQDKMVKSNWAKHIGKSPSLFVNISTWGLLISGKLLKNPTSKSWQKTLKSLINRAAEPTIRQALGAGIRLLLAKQFVQAQTIDEALQIAKSKEADGYLHSYDMLGEGARTTADAKRYLLSYKNAILKLGASLQNDPRPIFARSSISIKLSALHPRYRFSQFQRVMDELASDVADLVVLAKDLNVPITIDAEESDRLDLSLDLMKELFLDPRIEGWNGLGLAVQAYQRRASYVIEWLRDFAREHSRMVPIRLVKGAYWDSEIKKAQELGVDDYPVFTRKVGTDVSYLACAKIMLEASDVIFPQFATHNAYSVARIIEMAKYFLPSHKQDQFEFQKLHGMADDLYEKIVGENALGITCRIYAPVGTYEDLLPYLVRRLLENGANTSFVAQVLDDHISIDQLTQDPVKLLKNLTQKPHPKIISPKHIYGAARMNSKTIDLTDQKALQQLEEGMNAAKTQNWDASPIIAGKRVTGGQTRDVLNPANRKDVVGKVTYAGLKDVDHAMNLAVKAFESWHKTSADSRAQILEKAADLLEENMPALMMLTVREAGKTLPDAIAEIREAVDFCRYYALKARELFGQDQILQGPTGESNALSLHGRGVFVAISPWNFPLAIFVGQVTAALAAGNCVIAKPADQTPLIAAYAVSLLHKAGIPSDVLHFMPGRGSDIGQALIEDPRTAGIVFTGSTATAKMIQRTVAAKDGPMIPIIAETGGQNCMIVDSSALIEQVVDDVMTSSFQSAGQRCSALRVLYLQDEIYDKAIHMIEGAMAELTIGDPALLSTDVGPMIDQKSCDALAKHAHDMELKDRLIYQRELPESLTKQGSFLAPTLCSIDSVLDLEQEYFGAILHVVRYKAKALDQVLADINASGYGLTLGIHSRIDSTIQKIMSTLKIGNIYVNRSMIGAVVGVQPFGGEGLSGTGPKAGGPYYLLRFATERTVTINTTAVGGNASLMADMS